MAETFRLPTSNEVDSWLSKAIVKVTKITKEFILLKELVPVKC